MDAFWTGFEKRAASVGQVVGRFSKSHTPPLIPGPKPHIGKATALPGQGALVPGIKRGVLKNAPSSGGMK